MYSINAIPVESEAQKRSFALIQLWSIYTINSNQLILSQGKAALCQYAYRFKKLFFSLSEFADSLGLQKCYCRSKSVCYLGVTHDKYNVIRLTGSGEVCTCFMFFFSGIMDCVLRSLHLIQLFYMCGWWPLTRICAAPKLLECICDPFMQKCLTMIQERMYD